jgi:hypothetical protein
MATTLAFHKKQVPEVLTAVTTMLEEAAGKKKE